MPNHRYLIIICIGFIGYNYFSNIFITPKITPNKLEFYNYLDKEITIFGEISKKPEVFLNKIKYEIIVNSIELENSKSNVQGKALITTKTNQDFQYKDKIQAKGKLYKPQNWSSFDYQKHLLSQGIGSLMNTKKIELIQPYENKSLVKSLYTINSNMNIRLRNLFPEPHASFLAGLLLGSRQNISKELMTKFNNTGLTHLIAISGFNIVIIIVFIQYITNFLPQIIRYFVLIISITLFTIFVGSNPPVVRASIMCCLALTARLLHCPTNNFSLLILTVTIMLIDSPLLINYNISWQLSFMAVLGIIYLTPILEHYLKFIPQIFFLRNLICLTLAAQISTLPILIKNFGRLSLISPIANLLVAPLIPLTMFTGFISIFLSYVNYTFSLVIAYIAFILLNFELWLVDICATIPRAAISLNINNWIIILLYYCGLFLIIIRKRKLLPKRVIPL